MSDTFGRHAPVGKQADEADRDAGGAGRRQCNSQRPRDESDRWNGDCGADCCDNCQQHAGSSSGRTPELAALGLMPGQPRLDVLFILEQSLASALGNNHINVADLIAKIEAGLVGKLRRLAVVEKAGQQPFWGKFGYGRHATSRRRKSTRWSPAS